LEKERKGKERKGKNYSRRICKFECELIHEENQQINNYKPKKEGEKKVKVFIRGDSKILSIFSIKIFCCMM